MPKTGDKFKNLGQLIMFHFFPSSFLSLCIYFFSYTLSLFFPVCGIRRKSLDLTIDTLKFISSLPPSLSLTKMGLWLFFNPIIHNNLVPYRYSGVLFRHSCDVGREGEKEERITRGSRLPALNYISQHDRNRSCVKWLFHSGFALGVKVAQSLVLPTRVRSVALASVELNPHR